MKLNTHAFGWNIHVLGIAFGVFMRKFYICRIPKFDTSTNVEDFDF